MHKKQLNTFCLVTTILYVILSSASGQQDIIKIGDSAIKGDVTSITAKSIIVDGSTNTISKSKVSRIDFAASDVVAQQTSIVLKNGTSVSGTIREATSSNILFRSTSIGLVSFAMSDISRILFSDKAFAVSEKIPKDMVIAVYKSGIKKRGTLISVLANQIVLRSDEGLEKISFESLASIDISSGKTDSKIILRNGDIINEPVAWTGKGMNVSVNNKDVFIGLDAIKTINIKKESGE